MIGEAWLADAMIPNRRQSEQIDRRAAARLSICSLCLLFGIIASASQASPIIFHERAFADTVIDSSLHAPYDVPASALGVNDWTSDMVGVNQWGSDIGVATPISEPH